MIQNKTIILIPSTHLKKQNSRVWHSSLAEDKRTECLLSQFKL